MSEALFQTAATDARAARDELGARRAGCSTRWVLDALGAAARAHPWSLDVVEGQPGPVLVERSRHAALLVLGTGEHVGLRRVVSGSVGHYCLTRTPCPMVAIPAGQPSSGDGSQSG